MIDILCICIGGVALMLILLYQEMPTENRKKTIDK